MSVMEDTGVSVMEDTEVSVMEETGTTATEEVAEVVDLAAKDEVKSRDCWSLNRCLSATGSSSSSFNKEL